MIKHIKSSFLLIWALLSIYASSFCQSPKFDRTNFPKERFKVTYDTTHMAEFDVVLIVARPIQKSMIAYQGTKIWVQRHSKGAITEKYVGELDTEQGFYRPLPQPLKDVFIIVECSEYSGNINLITHDGDFISFPGYYFALNREGFIYSTTSFNGKLLYEYDLKNKSGTDLKDKNVKYNNLLFYEVEGSFWIK